MPSHSNARLNGKAAVAAQAFSDLISEASRRGFYGTVSLTLSIQDGSIQQVRATTERTVR